MYMKCLELQLFPAFLNSFNAFYKTISVQSKLLRAQNVIKLVQNSLVFSPGSY